MSAPAPLTVEETKELAQLLEMIRRRPGSPVICSYQDGIVASPI
jgi:hypothetical protein